MSSPTESTTHSPNVVAFDRLAERLAAAVAPPLRLAVARTPAELTAIHRLRYEHVVAHGWARPEQLPDGVERDHHDDDALQIGAWNGAGLVGTIRVTLPSPDRSLPVEEAFELEVEPAGAVADIGRLVIAPRYRGDPAHRIWGALLGQAWLETRAHGLAVMAAAASPALTERYRALGHEVEVLGRARHYWGKARQPLRLVPAATERPGWFDTAPGNLEQ